METFYLEALTMACTAFGVLVFLANLRYARDGLPQGLRQYLFVKGIIALFAALVYAATVLNIFEPAPPSSLTRSLMGLLLLLMFLDTVVRDADAALVLKVLAVKLKMEREKAEVVDNGQAPQPNAEAPKDA
jgi:hypothetical protein